MINEILKYNKEFVANKGYEKFVTNKYPDKKLEALYLTRSVVLSVVC